MNDETRVPAEGEPLIPPSTEDHPLFDAVVGAYYDKVPDPDNPDNVVGKERGTISKFTVARTLKDALKGQRKIKFTRPPEWTVR